MQETSYNDDINMEEALEGKATYRFPDYEDRTSEVLYDINLKSSTEIMPSDEVKNEIKLEPSVGLDEVIIDYLNNIKTEVVSGETNKYCDTSERDIKNEELVLKYEDSACASGDELGNTKNSVNDNEQLAAATTQMEEPSRHREKFNCTGCGYFTYLKSSWIRHLVFHSSSCKRRFCPSCGRSFVSKQNIDSHIFNKHSDNQQLIATITNKIHECPQCSYKSLSAAVLKRHLLKHKEILNDFQKFYCAHCAYFTYHKHDLIQHLVIHSSSCNRHVCPRCGRNFLHKNTIDSHIVNRHSDDQQLMATITHKIHYCERCSFRSIMLHKLIKHMLTHTEGRESKFTRDHVCTSCHTRFNRKCQIDAHIVSTHSDNQQLMATITSTIYRCEECPYKVIHSRNFKRHLAMHNKIRWKMPYL